MQTRPCNLHPFSHHFDIVKLGFTGVYIFFHLFALKHRLWVLGGHVIYLREAVRNCAHDLYFGQK